MCIRYRIRDGEQLDTAYYDTTEIAIYFIEKSFDIERYDDLVVPAAKVNSIFSNGEYTCLRDNSIMSESEYLDRGCPNVDTTFTDIFKITQVTNMTMQGSGVEYGQKVYTWLSKGNGIIKSEMYYLWSEDPFGGSNEADEIDELGRSWNGWSKIELARLDVEKSGNVFRQFTNPAQIVDRHDFGDLPDFDFDPFYINTQSGIQTLDLRELGE